MKKYDDVYDFNVIRELEADVPVHCHDKETGKSVNLAKTTVQGVVKYIKLHKENPTRITFYKEVEGEK